MPGEVGSTSNLVPVKTRMKNGLHKATGGDRIRAKRQQRPAASKSSIGLYVACERSTALETSVVGGQT